MSAKQARERTRLQMRMQAWLAAYRLSCGLAAGTAFAGLVVWPIKGFAVATFFWFVAALFYASRPPPDPELDRFTQRLERDD